MRFETTSYGRRVGFDVRNLFMLEAMLSELDPRPVAEQMAANYAHGGGWVPFAGFTKRADHSLMFKGDPPLRPLAMGQIRNEVLAFYEGEWLAVIALDRPGYFEVSRVD